MPSVNATSQGHESWGTSAPVGVSSDYPNNLHLYTVQMQTILCNSAPQCSDWFSTSTTTGRVHLFRVKTAIEDQKTNWNYWTSWLKTWRPSLEDVTTFTGWMLLNGFSSEWLQQYISVCTAWVQRTWLASASRRGGLRSVTTSNLVVPRWRLSTYGTRAFSVAGPVCWNALPEVGRSFVRCF